MSSRSFLSLPAPHQLDELLKDSGAIRVARARDRPPDALIPLGQSDDYTAPVVERPLDLGTVRVVATTSCCAYGCVVIHRGRSCDGGADLGGRMASLIAVVWFGFQWE